MKRFTAYTITAFFTIALSNLCTAQTPVFYGMTEGGGSHDSGTIFIFNPINNKDSVLWNFISDPDGKYPYADFVYDTSNGLFYGTTIFGGSDNTKGTIISFNPLTNAENVVWSFGSGTDGANPTGNIIYDQVDGLFYGMTGGGGLNKLGVIFSFNPLTNTENVVWNFAGSPSDGAEALASLVYNKNNGLYYGTTYAGGSNTDGTIFSFNPTNDTEKIIWNFGDKYPDGVFPHGSLVYYADSDIFYGTTEQGGLNGGGTLFSFNPSTNTEKLVWNFGSDTDGRDPNADLVYDANNNLFYGMTGTGGINYSGTIISFNPTNNSENVVWDFGSAKDGQFPGGDLVYDTLNGLFYGMTELGGSKNYGVILSFKPSTDTEKVVWNFGNGQDGQSPSGSLILYPQNKTTGIKTFTKTSAPMSLYPNPNNGNFTLQLQNLKQTTELQIFNVLGEKIYAATLNSTSNPINLSNHVAGIYLYRVLDEQGNQVGDGKFVIE